MSAALAVDFETTAYGLPLSGRGDAFGWTSDQESAQILATLDPSQRRRAELRMRRAWGRAFDHACTTNGRRNHG